MHAHLIATDGTVTPCNAGPADYEWDGETPFLIPIRKSRPTRSPLAPRYGSRSTEPTKSIKRFAEASPRVRYDRTCREWCAPVPSCGLRAGRRPGGSGEDFSVSLQAFWFEFGPDDRYGCTLPFACGVTAASEDEALALVANQFTGGEPLPPRRRTIQNVRLDEIEAKWGQLDFGVPVVRGIWVPTRPEPVTQHSDMPPRVSTPVLTVVRSGCACSCESLHGSRAGSRPPLADPGGRAATLTLALRQLSWNPGEIT